MKDQSATSWNDVLFENRNKEYGAYFLRNVYGRNVTLALLSTVATAALVFAFPAIVRFFSSDDHVASVKESKQTVINLDQPPPILPDQPPPPKLDVPPPVKTIIKFLPPKVTDKQVVEDKDMPTIDDMKKNESAPEPTEGTGEVVFTEPVKEAEGDASAPTAIFIVVEQPPEYPGGMQALYKYMYKNIKYPAQARRMGTEGTVYVSFIVDADGTISDVQVIKGIGAGCDEEAKRAIQALPPWKPGKQRGRPVRVRFTLPLKFTLGA